MIKQIKYILLLIPLLLGTTAELSAATHSATSSTTCKNFAARLGDADQDRDGIVDARELMLAEQWAPRVKLAHKEPNRPSSLKWYLDRAVMNYGSKRLGAGKVVKTLAPRRNANIRTLDEQSVDKISTSSGIKSGDQPSGSKWFQTRAAVRTSKELKQGQPIASHQDWPVYVHVRPNKDRCDWIDLQYWFFYPYNSKTVGVWPFKSGAHEGDWEHLTLVLDGQEKPQYMWLSQHGTGRASPTNIDTCKAVYKGSNPKGNATKVAQCEIVEGDKRFVVYSASRSHATFAGNGRCQFDKNSARCLSGPSKHAQDFTCYGQQQGNECLRSWNVWKNLVNLGEKGYTDVNALNFTGKWGKGGPEGPAQKRQWEQDFQYKSCRGGKDGPCKNSVDSYRNHITSYGINRGELIVYIPQHVLNAATAFLY